jgi:hypothetical protein
MIVLAKDELPKQLMAEVESRDRSRVQVVTMWGSEITAYFRLVTADVYHSESLLFTGCCVLLVSYRI